MRCFRALVCYFNYRTSYACAFLHISRLCLQSTHKPRTHTMPELVVRTFQHFTNIRICFQNVHVLTWNRNHAHIRSRKSAHPVSATVLEEVYCPLRHQQRWCDVNELLHNITLTTSPIWRHQCSREQSERTVHFFTRLCHVPCKP